MRTLPACVAAFAAVLAALGASVDAASAPARAQAPLTEERRAANLLPHGSRYLLPRIARKRRETWRWQRLMGKTRTRTAYSARRSRNPDYRRWVLRLWRKRAAKARRQAKNPPRKWAWLCIHRHEGAWTDPAPPYYGGLQMDVAFQRAYGRDLLRRKGTANNWTPIEQMWVAERAYRVSGFHPGPNTARRCGLI